MAVIPLGQAKIKTGYIRIFHPIDLIQIGNTIAKINQEIQTNPYPNSLYELIQIKNAKLYETFMKLKPFVKRQKRWDTIGRVWKWIAGNPDAEDLRIINTTLNSLINNNNKQVMINDAISNRIREITEITNQVLTLEKDRMKNHTIEMNQLVILSNLDSLQNQVETLEEAVLMAKHRIPSSKILSMQDFKLIVTFLEKHEIHITSFEELLSQSEAQVTLSEKYITYILKVPQLSTGTYEYNYIDSIIKNNKRIFIKYNYVIKNNSNVYELTQPCEESDKHFICDNSYLINPSECIEPLIQGRHSNCTFEKVYSNGLVKQINQGTLLVNDAKLDISSNCSNSIQTLTGSFLIQFKTCDLRIGGETYTNFEMTIPGHAYNPTTGLRVHEANTIDTPSPDYLKNLTLEHRTKLEAVHLVNDSLSWKINLFGSFGTLSIIGIGALIVFLFCSSKSTNLSVKFTPTKEKQIEVIGLKTPTSAETIPSTSDELSAERKKEIEAFVNTPTPFRTAFPL